MAHCLILILRGQGGHAIPIPSKVEGGYFSEVLE